METLEFLRRERQFFVSGERRSIAQRRELLARLQHELTAELDRVTAALYDDLRKSEAEALMTEFYPLLSSIRFMRRHLKRFASPRRAGVTMLNWPGRGRIYPEQIGRAHV